MADLLSQGKGVVDEKGVDQVAQGEEHTVAPGVQELPRKILTRVQALQRLQSEQIEVEINFAEELASYKRQLERKYEKLYEPFFKKRREIVTGEKEAATETDRDEPKGVPEDEAKGVPEFWLTVLKNSRDVRQFIEGKDEEVLKYLQDIRCNHVDGGSPASYKLEFAFDPNPYFSNAVLTKTFLQDGDGDPLEEETDVAFERAVGTTIDWKEGYTSFMKSSSSKEAMTVPPSSGKEESENEGSLLDMAKLAKNEGFFSFFDTLEIPEDESKIDRLHAVRLRGSLMEHVHLGGKIKREIIPHAVNWWYNREDTDEEEDVVEEGDDEEKEERVE